MDRPLAGVVLSMASAELMRTATVSRLRCAIGTAVAPSGQAPEYEDSEIPLGATASSPITLPRVLRHHGKSR